MPFAIRPATPADYEAVAVLCNAASVDPQGEAAWHFTAADLAEAETDRPANCRFARWVAVQDDQVVGAGEYDQTPHRYHPRKFWIDIYVHPAYQGQGIGAALYDQVLAGLASLNPLSARNGVREDFARSVAFAQRRGWQDSGRTWESVLDLANVDLAAYAPVLARMEAAGVAVKTFDELASDPDRDRKLYDLVWEVRQDLPDLDPPVKEEYDYFVSHRLHHPDMAPGGFLVVVKDGAYLGYIYHYRESDDPGRLFIAQLGVARAWRGQGLAWGLKVHSVAYACANGYRALRTDNDSRNAPILSINERMGFVRKPAWIHFVKVFAENP